MKRATILNRALLLTLLSLSSVFALAHDIGDTDPHQNQNGNGHPNHVGYGWGHHKEVPIDGGLGLLAAAGVLYGVKRARDARKSASR